MYTNGTSMKPAKVQNGSHPPPLPYSLDAEESVICSLFIDPDAILDVIDIVSEGDFYKQSLGRVYMAIKELFQSGVSGHNDPFLIADKLNDDDFVNKVYYPLFNIRATSANVISYARIVSSMATRRRLIRFAEKTANIAFDMETDVKDGLSQIQDLVLSATEQHGENRPLTAKELAKSYLDTTLNRLSDPGKISGIPSGYFDIDKILRGIKKKRLYIVAGRPGMGKSSFVRGMMTNMSINGNKKGLMVSLEMSHEEIVDLWAAEHIGVQAQDIQSGFIPEEKQGDLHHFIQKLSESKVSIFDKSANLSEILTFCKRQQIESGLDYVVIDHLLLVNVPNARDTYQLATRVSNFSKQLAMNLDIPVILLSQLSRNCEQRMDKRPMLSDLRDSGAIEQDADVVMFLYRDEYYDEATADPSVCEVNIAKHRGGPCGRARLYFNKETSAFRNLQTREITL